jgi:hypothetical protein
MKDRDSCNRRRFIRSVTAAGASLGLPAIAPSLLSGAVRNAAPSRPEVAAIYCPLWHRYDHMDAWHGYGWCEWELVKTAPPRFPGHYQPLRPSWGFFDESDPKWSQREIDLAADHVAADPKRPPAVFVNAWNEWTEGSYLLPEEKHGTACLKALQEAFRGR